MLKEQVTKKEWANDISGNIFQNVLFDELIVRNCTIQNVSFKNCDFKNCYIGFGSRYINCLFDKCSFYGMYSSFGNPKGDVAIFHQCSFINSKFKGLTLFQGVKFQECTFSGLFQNIILASGKNLKNSEVKFESCNLKEIIFKDISIYGTDIFKNCVLPSQGVCLYDNANDSLIEKAKTICSISNENNRKASEIIFNEQLHKGQSLIILDDFFLSTFFKTKECKEIFDKIVDGFIIDLKKFPDNRTWNV